MIVECNQCGKKFHDSAMRHIMEGGGGTCRFCWDEGQAAALSSPSVTYAATSDPVNSPQHYKGANGIESIDVIEAFGLGFALGNTVKYLLRAGKKTGNSKKQDLRKAMWYLAREIEKIDE